MDIIALTVVLGVVLLAGIVAAWDAACKQIAAARHNQQTLDRFAALDREIERLQQQQQHILGKLNAVGGAQATRLSRNMGMRA